MTFIELSAATAIGAAAVAAALDGRQAGGHRHKAYGEDGVELAALHEGTRWRCNFEAAVARRHPGREDAEGRTGGTPSSGFRHPSTAPHNLHADAYGATSGCRSSNSRRGAAAGVTHEADPSFDIEGHDTAQKLSICELDLLNPRRPFSDRRRRITSIRPRSRGRR